jgi:hypothetical protein
MPVHSSGAAPALFPVGGITPERMQLYREARRFKAH